MLPSQRRAVINRYISENMNRPFEDGKHYCVSFAAGLVFAITGRDYLQEWGGNFSTINEGMILLRRAGFRNHIEYIKTLFPETKVPQLGDLVIFRQQIAGMEMDAVGIMQGSHIYAVGEYGLILVPAEEAKFFLEVK